MSDVPMQVVTTDRDLTATEARVLTQEIRNDVAAIEFKIVKAWQGRAWVALGYESWDAYIAGEFKQAPLALPRQERQSAVQSLRGWGLSTRAIAPAVGVSHPTVLADERATGQNLPVEERPKITGLNGKQYQPTQRKTEPTSPVDPAPITTTCPTCGGIGKVTR